MKPVTPHLFQIALGAVNCFVIDDGEGGLILVDTGFPGSTEKIFKSIEKGGRSPKDIRRIIMTHTHPDHAGSAAEIAQKTGAKLMLHRADAELARQGIAGRMPQIVSPGLVNRIVYSIFIKGKPNEIPRLTTYETVEDGDVLPVAGGIRIIHTPGHSLGHIALYLQQDDVLIAGDICANVVGLDLSTVYEDRAEGVRSILNAAQTPFSKAVFGHGRPLLKDAAKRMREKFSQRQRD